MSQMKTSSSCLESVIQEHTLFQKQWFKLTVDEIGVCKTNNKKIREKIVVIKNDLHPLLHKCHISSIVALQSKNVK